MDWLMTCAAVVSVTTSVHGVGVTAKEAEVTERADPTERAGENEHVATTECADVTERAATRCDAITECVDENKYVEENEHAGRRAHVGFGVGGTFAGTGSERTGWLVAFEFLPGKNWGRLGVRLSARGGSNDGLIGLAGLAFEAGASRPRLDIILTTEIGASSTGHPIAAAGVETHLGVLGPIGIALNLNALLVVDGTQDTKLILSSGLLARIAH